MTTKEETVYGYEIPRLYTKPLRELTAETSLGFEILEFGESIGLVALPYQRWLLIHMFELLQDGQLRFRKALIMISRQNGKSWLSTLLALWVMRHRGTNVVFSSATTETARDQFLAVGDTAETFESVFGEVKVRSAAGQFSVALKDYKCSYRVVASNRRGGRGLTKVGLVVVDELREHHDWDGMAAIESTQLSVADSFMLMLSNAGDMKSVVLNQLQAAGEQGSDPEMFFASFSAPPETEDILDIEAIRQANPALGHTITLRSLLSTAGTAPITQFKTENLCIHVPMLNAAVQPAAWESCLNPGLITQRARVALGLDANDSLTRITVVAAVSVSGRTRVETVAVYESAKQFRAEFPSLVKRVKPKQIGWFPSGPASALRTDMKDVKRTTEFFGDKVASVCMELSEQVSAGRISHSGDETLTTQILSASRLKTGDAWRFARSSEIDVESSFAMAAAVKLARSIPESQGLRVVTLDDASEAA